MKGYTMLTLQFSTRCSSKTIHIQALSALSTLSPILIPCTAPHTVHRVFSTNSTLLAKDYYAILGLSRNATAADIKKAYLEAAKLHHPDSTGLSDRKENERFHEVSEAYEVLGDKTKKLEYDITHRHRQRMEVNRYAAHARSWGRDTGMHSNKHKDNLDEHFEKPEDELHPTTSAEYVTYFYCGVVTVFSLYVLYKFIV